MSKMETKLKYHCYNDCKPEGCPGHTATLHIQTVSDSIHFDDGCFQHDTIFFDPTTLEVFMKMLKELDYLPKSLERSE